MKLQGLLISLFLVSALTRAEVFLGPTSPSNRFVVNTNEAIIFSALTGELHEFESLYAQLVLGGQTNDIRFSSNIEIIQATALAGPAELWFTNRALISFRRIQGSAIRSVVVTTNSPQTIQVASNQTIRFFDTTAGRRLTDITVGSVTVAGFVRRCEFSGPLTFTLKTGVDEGAPNIGVVWSYYFTEGFLVVPETGLIQGPTGSFEITIEKSSGLSNWAPVVVHGTSADQRAFYRMKISK